MNILYCSVSTIDPNTVRQRINEKDFCEIEIIEDRCSGAILFFEREGGEAYSNAY
jgi:DNA invertase Pin-like site-specific DNA recombinase